MPRDQALVSVFDRGFLFGDGLYEGLRAFDGRVVAMDLHVERLRQGLAECRIAWDAAEMAGLTDELLRANNLRDAFIYWQVTRGTPGPGQAVRGRVPAGPMMPTVMGFCYPTSGLAQNAAPAVKRAVISQDTRWLRGRVKSISLLGGVLAAIEAHEHGADDAILVRDGLVAEGTSSNVFVALEDGFGGTRIATPSLQSAPILAGVTRDLLLAADPAIEERSISVRELVEAREIMLAGTLSMVTSVVEIGGRPVGTGRPGPCAAGLLELLLRLIHGGR